MIKMFFRDSLIYAIPSLLSRGLSLFLLPLYTRVLSPADYGSLEILIVFASLANLTVALEVSQGVARFYGAEKDACKKIEYASTSFWFTLFCYCCFFFLTLLFAPLLAPFIIGRADTTSIFCLAMAYIAVNGMFYLVQNQFRWALRSKQYAICSILVTLITALLSVILVYIFQLGLGGLLAGMLGGASVGFLYGIINLRDSYKWVFCGDRLKEMLLFSAPLVPSGVAVFLSNYIDRLMINHFLTLEDLGVYGIGFRISNVVSLVLVGFQGALMPLIYKNYHLVDTPRQISLIFRTFLFFAFLMCFFLVGFSRELLCVFTVPDFYGAADVMRFLVPALLLSNMYIFAPGLGIAKKTCFVLFINIAVAVFNICANCILIPILGIQGAALATLLGYTLSFFLYLLLSQRFYPINYGFLTAGKALGITTIFLLFSCYIDLNMGMNLLIKGLFLLLLFLSFIYIGLVSREEISKSFEILRKTLHRRPLF